MVADARLRGRCWPAQPDTAPDVGERSADDLYGLWTGGTTGMPKGVMWRHEDIYLSRDRRGGNPALGDRAGDATSRTSRPDGRRAHPIPGTLSLCPLMHGGGFWLIFSALFSGTYGVVIRDIGFDPAFAMRVAAEERVSVVMTIGDAYARPIVDLLDDVGPEAYDLSALADLRVGRRDPVAGGEGSASPGAPDHDRRTTAFGASETGGQVGSVGTGPRTARPASRWTSNVVIADDGTPVPARRRARSGTLAPAATSRSATTRTRPRRRRRSPSIDGVR